MIPEKIKEGFRKYLQTIAAPLARIHLSPNALTFLGFVAACLAAYLLAIGFLVAAAGVIVIAALFDVLDGALARAKAAGTSFGAFL